MKFKMLVLALALGATPLAAQSVQDHVVKQLQSQGFLHINIERTFLGRIRIEAYSDRFERELVINPNTGEILRDYWELLDESDKDDSSFDHLPDPHDDVQVVDREEDDDNAIVDDDVDDDDVDDDDDDVDVDDDDDDDDE